MVYTSYKEDLKQSIYDKFNGKGFVVDFMHISDFENYVYIGLDPYPLRKSNIFSKIAINRIVKELSLEYPHYTFLTYVRDGRRK